MGHKLGVSIRYNRLRHTMEPNDLAKIQLRNIAIIINLVVWNKVSHFGKSIHSHHDCILHKASKVWLMGCISLDEIDSWACDK